MSDSLIAFQPAIDEPSNITPSVSSSSSTVATVCARCCHLPRGSVKRKSTYLTSFSLIIASTFFASVESAMVSCVLSMRPCLSVVGSVEAEARDLERVGPALAGADADDLFDRGDEDLAVADAAGAGGLLDGLAGAFHLVVLEHDLQLHLGQEIDHVLGAAIELRMALLAAEALGLRHRDALDADLVQGLLHVVELERLDDGFDLLHFSSRGRDAPRAPARDAVTLH